MLGCASAAKRANTNRFFFSLTQLLLCLLVVGYWGASSAWAATCSAYQNQAFLNEVRIGSTKSLNVNNQVEIFNSSNLASAVWKTWKVQIYYRSDANATPAIYTYPLSAFANNGQFIYNTGSMYLRNRTRSGRGLDIALLDSAGNYIDYIAMGFSLQTVPACMPVKVVSFSSSSNRVGDLARLPDAGTWPNSVTQTSVHTIGSSNQCSAGVSDLTVNQSADNLTPLLNSTLVTYTINVTNKSCTNTINGVQVNTSNLLASNFSGLATSATTGSVSTVGTNLVWAVGNLAKGIGATLTVTGTPSKLGALTSTASVAAPTTGLSNLTDDSRAVTITVRDFTYVGFDLASDTLTEGVTTAYSAGISSTVVPTKAITVNYTITGTATATDTSLGTLPKSGSVIIDPTNADSPNNITIDFDVLNDGIYEPNKTITITIDSVTSADGSVKLDPAATTMTLNLADDEVPNPLAEYRFDTNSPLDSSGNNRNGTLIGAVTTSTVGKVCNSYTFSASSQYVTVAGLSNLLSGTASLSFWINTTQVGTASPWTSPGVTGVEQGGGGNDIFWGWIDPTGKIAVSKGNTLGAQSISSINSGTWRHIVLTRDQASGATTAYVNGGLESTRTSELGLVTTAFSSIGRMENAKNLTGALDEVKVFAEVLNSAQVASLYANESAGKNWDGTARVCPVSGPDHLELVHDGSALTCTAEAVTVLACTKATSCNGIAADQYTAGTVTLTPTPISGAQWCSDAACTTPISGAITVANNTAIYLKEINARTDRMAGTTSPAVTTALQCKNTSTNAFNATTACDITFGNAGFIIASALNGPGSTVPTQTAGTASGTYYLRAVQTGSTTKACEAALTGAQTVNWAYQCNNPTTCSGSNLMAVNGGASTTIQRNNNSVAAGSLSTTSVNMVFDANGNAPFTFTFSDVGQATMYASKVVNSATLSGNSNAFVTKPAGFTVTGIQQFASPNLANPAAASLAGSKFVKSGESFTAIVTATTSGGAATPNYGKETAAEGVLLTHALVLPTSGSGGVAGTLANKTVAGSSFTTGAATVNNLSWSEAGIITLSPSVADGDYLGTGAIAGTTTGNIGRFYPSQFAVAPTSSTQACNSSGTPFSYFGQDGFTNVFTVTPQNTANGTVLNYQLTPPAATWNTWALMKMTATTLPSGVWPGGAVLAASPNSPTATSIPTKSVAWNAGVATVTMKSQVSRPTALTAATSLELKVEPTDSDGVKPASPANVGTALMRWGRLKLSNVFGSGKANLQMDLQAQYWSGASWVLNSDDHWAMVNGKSNGCTSVPGTAFFIRVPLSGVAALDSEPDGVPDPVRLEYGVGKLILTRPTGNNVTGSVDVAVNLGSGTQDQSCPVDPPHGGSASNLSWLRSQNGSCATTYDRDPSARATFGIYSGESKKTVHIRELF
jgi:MSHA biogenesis protein MshQ